MVKKYDSKTRRYCSYCDSRHPPHQICQKNLRDKKINKRKRYFDKDIQNQVACWNETFNQRDETDTKFLKDWYRKDKHKEKKGTRSRSTHRDFHLRQDKKLKPTLPIKECPVCLVEKKVKMLGCRHSICQPCWASIVSSQDCADNCPLCRKELFVSENYYNYICEEPAPQARQFVLHRVEWNEYIPFNLLSR